MEFECNRADSPLLSLARRHREIADPPKTQLARMVYFQKGS